jgi:hypothetical protein
MEMEIVRAELAAACVLVITVTPRVLVFGMIEISVCIKTLERSIGRTSNRLVSMKIGEQQLETNTGTWPDKMEHFLTKFKDIAPAAKLQANMTTESMDNIGSDAFAFADMETLDANLVVTPRENPNADFTPKARDRARCLFFTITVSPQLIIPGQSTLTHQLSQTHHLQRCT